MKTVDALNHRFGRDSVSVGTTMVAGCAAKRISKPGIKSVADARTWAVRQDSRSPPYTTRWDEIPVVRTLGGGCLPHSNESNRASCEVCGCLKRNRPEGGAHGPNETGAKQRYPARLRIENPLPALKNVCTHYIRSVHLSAHRPTRFLLREEEQSNRCGQPLPRFLCSGCCRWRPTRCPDDCRTSQLRDICDPDARSAVPFWLSL